MVEAHLDGVGSGAATEGVAHEADHPRAVEAAHHAFDLGDDPGVHRLPDGGARRQEATTDEEYDSDDENVVVSNLA